jgi:glycerophosphoryl diester phosphodiesterase
MAILRPLLERARARRRSMPLVWPPLNIGHRGASGDAPENTLAAFELAVRQAADGIELDVHLSADGVPVVIHDARLDRTTSGSGRVREHSVAALKRLDAGSWFNRRFPSLARPRYVGQRIPLLSEVLEWARKRPCRVFIEIKEGGGAYPGIEAAVLENLHRAGACQLATVVSFDFPSLRRVRELDSRISVGLDFTRSLLALRRARALAATSFLPHWMIASRRFIRRAHGAGLQVIAWHIEQPRWMLQRIADGVDGIITNQPARLQEIRQGLVAKEKMISTKGTGKGAT